WCTRDVLIRSSKPFGEADWLTSDDPGLLAQCLDRLWQGNSPPLVHPRVSNRKLRLLACACCRVIWQLLTDQRSRDAVEVAERFAEGLATQEELARALDAAEAGAQALVRAGTHSEYHASYYAAYVAAREPSASTIVHSVAVGRPWRRVGEGKVEAGKM